MNFVKFTKRFSVRSESLFTIEHRLQEADSFKAPTSSVELVQDFCDFSGELQKDVEKLKIEFEALGFKYVELYKCDGQDDGIKVSIVGDELIFSQRGNLHTSITSDLEKRLSELGFEVAFEK